MVLRPLKFLKSTWLTVDLPLLIEGLVRGWGWDQAWKPCPLLLHHYLDTAGLVLECQSSLVPIEGKWEESSLVHHEAEDLQQLSIHYRYEFVDQVHAHVTYLSLTRNLLISIIILIVI